MKDIIMLENIIKMASYLENWKIYIYPTNNHKEQRNIRRDPVFPVSIKSVYIR